MVATIKIMIFSVVTLCSSVEVQWRFGGTSVDFHQTTQH
jgi:hypothetical protein